MKIIFKVIKAGSGNDIYFQRLSEALKHVNIDSKIEYYPKYFQYIPWALKIANKKTPGDIIHSNAEYGWVFKEKNIPLIVTIHNCVFDKVYQRYTSILQKIYHYGIIRPNLNRTLKEADKIITVSQFTKKAIIKEFGNYPIEVIFNFIDINKYKPLKIISKKKKFKLLFLGNLIKRKGAELLPKIMKKLGDNFILYYAFSNNTEIPSSFKISNMKSLGSLTQEMVVKVINECNALLFPTRLESFGYVAAEAMACGLPVISTNYSSLPELIKNGENGFLCKLDDIDEFVEKIKLLSSDRKLQDAISKNNRAKIVSQFSQKGIILNYKKVYESV